MRAFLTALLALAGTAGVAQTRPPELCAALQSDTARLACYDENFRGSAPSVDETESPIGADAEAPSAPVATPVEPAVRSLWSVRRTRSEVDDSERVVLTLTSSDSIRGRFQQPGPATMVVRCEENTTSVYLLFNDLFMSDIQGYGQVTVRVDERRAREISMGVSTDNMALGLWRGRTAIPFIRDLFGGERMFVRATPFNETRVEMTFPIAGLEEAVSPLREACGW